MAVLKNNVHMCYEVSEVSWTFSAQSFSKIVYVKNRIRPSFDTFARNWQIWKLEWHFSSVKIVLKLILTFAELIQISKTKVEDWR